MKIRHFYVHFSSKITPKPTGGTFSTGPTDLGTAEVPALRLRQAFWLDDVGGCKFEHYHIKALVRHRISVLVS
jgi:hypothetical protein